MSSTAASSRCRGPVAAAMARDALLVAAVPTATCGVLTERGLVTRGVPSLSALTGARLGVAGGVLGGDPPTGGTVPASRANFAMTPSTPGDGGGMGSHLPEVVCSPSLYSSSEDEFTSSSGGERPYCSCNK